MKVITIKQPFATLIAKGYKKFEFRTWKTNYRGDILIHAGKSIDKLRIKDFERYNLEFPLGCIIAKGKITDCVHVNDKFRKEVVPKDPIVYKGISKQNKKEEFAFKLEEVEEIEPIYINGKLGLWNYNYKI